ncbi:MAG: hypothetical protein LBC18_13335, partial [Opitutaceae bacterium]|nr:hypothetical protein [Opitutaceae bacterium]
ERVSLWVGATAGLFRDKYELTTESADSTGSDTNTLFVYGATAGASVKLVKGLTLDAGVRVLAVKQDAYEGIGAANLTIGRSTTYARPSVSLALGYTW